MSDDFDYWSYYNNYNIPAWGSRWKHLKRGTTYEVIFTSLCSETLKPLITYAPVGDLHAAFTRPIDMFLDGRFKEV